MKSSAFANQFLKLLYNAVAISGIADNTATSPLTSIYASLHTADPGAAGTQATNEVAYAGYARIAIARTAAGFTVTGNTAALAAMISFAQVQAAAGNALFFGFGAALTGAGELFRSGPLGSKLGEFTAATSGTITIPAHGLIVGSTVCFEAPTGGGALPTGITAGTLYYVTSVPTADTITVSTTLGGSAVAITASGDGDAYKVTPIILGANTTPQLNTTTTVIEG